MNRIEPSSSVGQERQQVGRLGQGRAAGHLDGGAQLVGQHRGERGLAQAGRAVEEDVRQRFLELLAGVEDDAQPLHHRLLADDLAQPAGPQGGVALLVLVAGVPLDDRLACHVVPFALSRKPGEESSNHSIICRAPAKPYSCSTCFELTSSL